MREKIQSGKNEVEAYNELGFDTSILSEDRANSAGKRAMKPDPRLAFEKDISKYDASIPFEEMLIKWKNGEMDRDDLYANMAARLIMQENEMQENESEIPKTKGVKKRKKRKKRSKKSRK